MSAMSDMLSTGADLAHTAYKTFLKTKEAEIKAAKAIADFSQANQDAFKAKRMHELMTQPQRLSVTGSVMPLDKDGAEKAFNQEQMAMNMALTFSNPMAAGRPLASVLRGQSGFWEPFTNLEHTPTELAYKANPLTKLGAEEAKKATLAQALAQEPAVMNTFNTGGLGAAMDTGDVILGGVGKKGFGQGGAISPELLQQLLLLLRK